MKQLERVSSRSSKRRRNTEGLRKNILKTLEMNYIYRNLKSKLETKSSKNSKRETDKDKNCWLPKNIRGDSKKRGKQKRYEWKRISRQSL